MQTPTTTQCPPWCVALHHRDALHVQEDTNIVDLDGSPLGISAFQVARTGRYGVYFGDYELSPAAAREAAHALLASADLAEQHLLALA